MSEKPCWHFLTDAEDMSAETYRRYCQRIQDMTEYEEEWREEAAPEERGEYDYEQGIKWRENPYHLDGDGKAVAWLQGWRKAYNEQRRARFYHINKRALVMTGGAA